MLIWPAGNDGNPPGIELLGELFAMLEAGVGGKTVRKTAAGVEPAIGMAVSSVKDGPGVKPPALLPAPRLP